MLKPLLDATNKQHSSEWSREGEIGVRQRRIERQMNRRFATAVPVAVRNTGGKDDERTRRAIVLFSFDFYAHRTAQDVKNLIDLMNMKTGWRAATGGRLDVRDRAVFGAGVMI